MKHETSKLSSRWNTIKYNAGSFIATAILVIACSAAILPFCLVTMLQLSLIAGFQKPLFGQITSALSKDPMEAGYTYGTLPIPLSSRRR